MPTKRTLRRWLAAEKTDRRRLIDERDDWKDQCHAERAAKLTAARVAAESTTDIARLTGRADRLKERLDAALDGRTDGEYTRLTERLEHMTLAYAKLREETTARSGMPLDWRAERSDLIRRLDLAQRARRSLAEQIDMLQRTNDSLSRDAVDRAGTLTAPKDTTREPGVAA